MSRSGRTAFVRSASILGMVTATTLIILLVNAVVPMQLQFVYLLPISVVAYAWGLKWGLGAIALSVVGAYLLLWSSLDVAGVVVARASATLLVLGGLNAFILARLHGLDHLRLDFRRSEEARELTERAVTARQRAEQAERSEQAAVKSESFQRVLLDTVAHDLKTPLTSILGAVSVLRDDPIVQSRRDTQELAALAYGETQRLVRLVADITHMADLEGGVRPRREESDVRGIVEAAMSELREGLAGRSCRLVVSPDLPLVVGDPSLLVHVFTNILANAAKYSPEGAPIDLRIDADSEGRVQVTVADRGVGVPVADLQRIFERQYNSGPQAGTGLGLAIAKGIVDAHAGRISAENREGGGTIVKVALPVH